MNQGQGVSHEYQKLKLTVPFDLSFFRSVNGNMVLIDKFFYSINLDEEGRRYVRRFDFSVESDFVTKIISGNM